MSQFFTSVVFINFCIPLGTVVCMVFIKAVCRDDSQPTFKKEDLSVGFELSLTSIVAFITYNVSIAQRASTMEESVVKQMLESKFTTIPWLLLGWFIGLWALSFLVRKMGWVANAGNSAIKEPTWIVGIAIPVIYGLLSLIFVVNWIE